MLDWMMDRPARMFGVMGGVFAVAVVGLGYLGVQEQKQWDAFAKAHECKVVGKIAGYSTYGYYNGKYQTYWVSSKTTYRCNDGIDYTR
jgi:hypothetical protein